MPSEWYGPRLFRTTEVPRGRQKIHSLRMPSFVLSCEVIFGADNERLAIRHDSGASAAPYVSGTLFAVRSVTRFVGLKRGLDSILGDPNPGNGIGTPD